MIFWTSNRVDGDFPVFYHASRTLLERQNPYNLLLYVENPNKGFTYPPIALLLTLIPSLLPLGFALILWTILSQLLWVVAVSSVDRNDLGEKTFHRGTGQRARAQHDRSMSLVFWLHQLTMPVFSVRQQRRG